MTRLSAEKLQLKKFTLPNVEFPIQSLKNIQKVLSPAPGNSPLVHVAIHSPLGFATVSGGGLVGWFVAGHVLEVGECGGHLLLQ